MASKQGSFVEDGNGNFIFTYSPPETEVDKIGETFNSSVKWAVAASVISGVVMVVAIVAIVYALIDCLKRAGVAIPAYARISTDDIITKTSSKTTHQSSSNHVVVSMQPEFPLVEDYATMERFLSDMARENPIRFSPQQVSEFTNNCSTILGSGGFGVVFKGELPNGVKVAVKVLTNHSKKCVQEQFMAEVGTIGKTYHINLVRLYGFCFDPSMKALVYEYMENGSLDTILFNYTGDIEREKLYDITIGIAKGIAYLHEECQQRIIHYDIKPQNILLDQDLNPKVADFGLAKLCNREISKVTMTGFRGTAGYAAPELWKPYPVTYKIDVYSFGMLLFEIVGRRRNHNANLSESRQWLPRWTWDMLKNNELPIMLAFCGVEEKNREKAERMCIVALWCVQYAPEARPSMSNVVKMLEGDMEISRPPNPFEYLESFGQNLPFQVGEGDTNDQDTSSSWFPQDYKQRTNQGQKYEIELATSV